MWRVGVPSAGLGIGTKTKLGDALGRNGRQFLKIGLQALGVPISGALDGRIFVNRLSRPVAKLGNSDPFTVPEIATRSTMIAKGETGV
jgi:hypothetical protein